MKLDVNNLPYFFGSHYSNPAYISKFSGVKSTSLANVLGKNNKLIF